MSNTINIDDFKKLDIQIGQILSVEKVLDSHKLLKLSVSFGLKKIVADVSEQENESQAEEKEPEEKSQEEIRQIISGIAAYYPDPQVLVGKKCAFAYNLQPRVIRGLESQGMIMAVSGENFFSLLETTPEVVAGSSVK